MQVSTPSGLARESVPLVGSERAPLPGARAVGDTDPKERVRITVIVRHKPGQRPLDLVKIASSKPSQRRYLDRKQFEASRGASPADISKVKAFARRHGISVLEASPSRRTVILSGTAAQVSSAFGVRLIRYSHPQGEYRGHEGSVRVPKALSTVVEAVLGLDSRPQASAHLRIGPPPMRASKDPYRGTFTPTKVASLYDFPPGLDGTGQCVAIIELGGGYNESDLKGFFSDLSIPMPNVVSVPLDGAKNAPTNNPQNPTDADGEVMLDIEVTGSVAPKAHIAVYFAPNTDAGFLDAVTTAVHDSRRNPSVISISWGQSESTWTAQAMKAMDQAFQDAASLGITVFAAAGDNGSSDGVSDGLAHVDFPAASPFVTGCGGTRLQAEGDQISGEVTWNELPRHGATGGGVSAFFPLPSWQARTGVPPSVNPGARTGRGVPDVSADADPLTGYYPIYFDGVRQPIGGTSAVAPLWSGLVALLNQKLPNKVGYLNPLLYSGIGASSAFNDVVSGDNPAYSAGKGWDACTGWGSPNGSELLSGL